MRTLLMTTLGLGFVMFSVACQSQSASQRINDAELSAAVKTKLTSDTRLASLTDVDVKARTG